MVDAPTLLPEGRPDDKARLGYVMVATAATLFAVNGSVMKVALNSGLSAVELTQLRHTFAALLFFVLLVVVAPAKLRVGRRELLVLVAFGLIGIALQQWLYLVAIENVPIGVALLIIFTAPLFVALFARFVYREHIRRRVWLALVLCITGLAIVVEIWAGVAFSVVGVTAAFGSALVLTMYMLMAERERRASRRRVALVLWLSLRRDPVGRIPAALDLSVVGSRRERLTPGQPLGVHGAGVGARRVRRRDRNDGDVLAADRVAPAHQRDARLDRCHCRARDRDRRGVGMAGRDARGRAARRRGRRDRRAPPRAVRPLTHGYPVVVVERVLLASPRGYCAGVERAVETVELALEHYGAPVYVRKQIVHNIHVVRDLEARGAIFVEEETEVPKAQRSSTRLTASRRPSSRTPRSSDTTSSTPSVRSSRRCTCRRAATPTRATRSS